MSEACQVSGGGRSLGDRVVRVASRVAAVESRPVVAGERQPLPNALRQIRIGDEVAAEGDEIGIVEGGDGFC